MISDSSLDANALILLFSVYYFVERLLRLVVRARDGEFYEYLRASRKDMVFFGIFMGFLISVISTPSCIRGAWSAWSAIEPGMHEPVWVLDDDAKFCITARAILWVSELNRLDLYPLYIIHHTGSLISLLSFLYFRWPIVLFLSLFATLVSEVPGDLLWMLASYIDSVKTPSPKLRALKQRLNIFNVAQYALIRGSGIVFVAWILVYSAGGLRTRPIPMQLHAYTLLFLYSAFCALYVYRQSCSIFRIRSGPPPSPVRAAVELGHEPATIRPALQLRLPTTPRLIVVPYGPLMGLGFAALVLVTLTIAPATPRDSALLSRALGITLLSAVFFARVFSLVLEDGWKKLLARPIRTLLRPGFWLHGGMFGAAIGAAAADASGLVPDFARFGASLAVGLPLYEVFSRIGCHTYGCCYGCRAVEEGSRSWLWCLLPFPAVRYSHPTDYAATRLDPRLLHVPLLPIQLISAALFLMLFAGVSVPLALHASPELAGAATVALHAAVRLVTETCRADDRGGNGRVSTTGKLALAQGSIGLSAASYILFFREHGPELLPAAFVPWTAGTSDCRIYASLGALLLGTLVYGVHVDQIGNWVPDADSKAVLRCAGVSVRCAEQKR
ncbi:unnamed protein product [Mycena citricolor]|uniref:Uncharacterized protein n=1 Tax=Mycena citricolor TaxID=2018698 RepID=A0AAD2K1R1_9AGAR|nr:unnamed protein product [Mycena citricolor]